MYRKVVYILFRAVVSSNASNSFTLILDFLRSSPLCFSISSKITDGNKKGSGYHMIIFLVNESLINAENSMLESRAIFN